MTLEAVLIVCLMAWFFLGWIAADLKRDGEELDDLARRLERLEDDARCAK